MENEQFSILLEYFSFSWAGYQKVKKGVKKRILRHMKELGCRDMSDYIRRLEADSAVKYDCERLLTVPISRFFRDYRLWEILPEKILPRFFANHTLRVWSAGCAGGEEIYSFKMIWEQLKEKYSSSMENCSFSIITSFFSVYLPDADSLILGLDHRFGYYH